MNSYAREMQEYKTQSINTMTPGEMLILLYDEVIKRLKRAELLLAHGNYPAFEGEIARCQEIIYYLKKSLNRSYLVSENLMQLYDFFNYQLIRLNAGRKKEIIDELIPLISELRDTFRQASQISMRTNNSGVSEG